MPTGVYLGSREYAATVRELADPRRGLVDYGQDGALRLMGVPVFRVALGEHLAVALGVSP